MAKPILIPDWPKSWPCLEWTFQSLADTLKEKQFSCRIWKKSNDQVFETNCEHVNVTLGNFCDWLKGNHVTDNPLHQYERKSHNCYIDYKYMKDMFESVPEMMADVRWADFGLTGFDGRDSTIWIGSEDSNTPCHQDSYGFNLVTQIQGRKMWILFPPEDMSYLYPTRIPYEESSVFSQVNVKNPDIQVHPCFKSTHPVVIVLSPGQTLYVPNRWWHYVESLEPSISINVWVPAEQDVHAHVSEAITRCIATSLITSLDKNDDSLLQNHLLNPTEDLFTSKVNFQCLKSALEKLRPLSVEETDERKGEGGLSCTQTQGEMIDSFNQTKDKGMNYSEQFQCWMNQCDVLYQPCPLSCSRTQDQTCGVSQSPKKRRKIDSVKPSGHRQTVDKQKSVSTQNLQAFSSSTYLSFDTYHSVIQNVSSSYLQGNQPQVTRVDSKILDDPSERPVSQGNDGGYSEPSTSSVISNKRIEINNIVPDMPPDELNKPCGTTREIETDPELVTNLISNVLHPTVIDLISCLVKTSYLRSINKRSK